MSKEIINWISSKKLMEDWNLDECELNQIVGPDKLPAYIIEPRDGVRLPIDEFAASYDPPFMDYECLVPQMQFFVEDVAKFETDNPKFFKNRENLNSKEKRKLGQLEREKEKWDNSIKAAVKMGLFCSEQKGSIT